MDPLAQLNEAIDFHHPGDAWLALKNGANPNTKCFSMHANEEIPALGRAWLEHTKDRWPVDHELFRVLIQGGANLVDRHARTVFKDAVDQSELPTVKAMFDKGYDLFGDISALYTQDLAVLTYLVEVQGMDINQTLDRRGTPLHHAIKMQREDLTVFLLDHQANMEASDFEGNTALLTAAEYQAHDLIPLLLARGAKPTVANFMGNTALHLVNDAASTDLLLKHGADPLAVNDCGFAPEDCEREHTIAALQAWRLRQSTPDIATSAQSRRL